jgi:hypothetical protein
MIKRIALALALAVSLGGAVLACNTPATTAPSVGAPASVAPPASNAAPSVEPSAS